MGYLAAFAVVFLMIVATYCFGYVAKQASLLYLILLETFVGVVILLPLMVLIDKINIGEIFTRPTKENWLWLGAASIFGFALGNYFSLMHIRTAGEKVNSLLSPAITALTIALSFFVFKEKLTTRQWLGVFITISIIAYFLFKQSGIGNLKILNQNIFSGIATIISISFTIICTIKGVGKLPFLLAIWLRLFVAFIIILVLFILKKEWRNYKPTKALFYPVIILSVLVQTIAAAYLWLYASSQISLAIFQVILATFPLFMYAVDVYLLKKSASAYLFLFVALIAGAGIVLAIL
jgi:drug/metabolite transporter (DMT)-like permease